MGDRYRLKIRYARHESGRLVRYAAGDEITLDERELFRLRGAVELVAPAPPAPAPARQRVRLVAAGEAVHGPLWKGDKAP